jgi:hypothetical protein
MAAPAANRRPLAGGSGWFVAKLTHPSAKNDAALLANWNQWLPQILTHVTPDPGGAQDPAPYGTTFKKSNLALPLRRAQVDGHGRYGVADVAHPDRVEVARG